MVANLTGFMWMILAESRFAMKNMTACIKGNRIKVSANLIQPKLKIHDANIINIKKIESRFNFVLVVIIATAFIHFDFNLSLPDYHEQKYL